MRISHNGEATELKLISNDGATAVFEVMNGAGACQRLRIAGHREGDTRQLWVNGRFFTYERIRQRRSSSGSGDDGLAASIPALVSQLLVQVGDDVTAGDKLILLESMKMIIPIQAPFDGQVTAVHCAVGDSVQAGIPLIEID